MPPAESTDSEGPTAGAPKVTWPDPASMKWTNYDPILGPLQSIALAADGQGGWAIGPRGMLKRTDGRWVRVDININTEELESWVLAVSRNGQEGWALGNRGSALRLRDGHWSPVTTPAPRTKKFPALAVDEDASVAWAWGRLEEDAQSGFYSWANGRWKRAKRSGDKGLTIRAIALAPDGRRGWAVSQEGLVIKLSRDIWEVDVNASRLGASQLFDLSLSADGRRGWAVGADERRGVALRLDDDVWTRDKHDFPFNLITVATVRQDESAWACGFRDDGCLEHREGLWQRSPKFAPIPSVAVDIALSDDGSQVWAAGVDGAPLDLRALSEGIRMEPLEDLHAVAVSSDGSRGWAVGNEGVVARLDDGRWSVDEAASALTSSTLCGLALDTDGVQGWAAGGKQTVLRLQSGVWRRIELQSMEVSFGTTQLNLYPRNGELWIIDDGTDVYRLLDGPNPRLEEVDIRAVKRAVLTSYGTFMSRSYIGPGWTLSESEPFMFGPKGLERMLDGHGMVKDSIVDAFAITEDGRHGWALGQTAWQLRDGSWQQAPESFDPRWSVNAVSLSADGEHGWAVGDDVLFLDDGRWHLKQASEEHVTALQALAISDDGRLGWAVGYREILSLRADPG